MLLKSLTDYLQVGQSETFESVDSLLVKTAIPLATQIGKICRERGLDTQNYECAGCKHPLAVTTKPRYSIV